MGAYYRFIIVLFLGLQSFAVTAQVPTKEELWHRYDSALSADIRDWKQAVILSSLDSVRNCLKKSYSSQRTEFYLGEIDSLVANPDLKESELKTLDTLRSLIENYQEETQRFIEIFKGIISDDKYQALVKQIEQPKSKPIPDQVQDIMSFLKGLYVENGLDTLVFDEDYKYLNSMLANMKDNIETIELRRSNDGAELDGAALYGLLIDILKVEGELSEEHKTYRELKDYCG